MTRSVRPRTWIRMLLLLGPLVYVALLYSVPDYTFSLQKVQPTINALERSFTLLPRSSTCEPMINVGFVKVHKAGSTTIFNILMRFAYLRNLSLTIPVSGHHIYTNISNVIPSSNNGKYNMVVNHVVHFKRKAFESVLSSDAKYIAIMREPLSQTVSAFQYYGRYTKFELYFEVPGPDKLRNYLQNREKYEPSDRGQSLSNNRMAYDFGLPKKVFRNKDLINKYLKKLDGEIDLVMIMEHFSESLVLLKRLLCWSLKDVLYIKLNANVKNDTNKPVFTNEELTYHRNFSMADNMFYDHFLQIFKRRLASQGVSFWEEVKVFNQMLEKVNSYCQTMENSTKDDILLFVATDFSEAFEIDAQDCELMNTPEILFTDKYREKQLGALAEKMNRSEDI